MSAHQNLIAAVRERLEHSKITVSTASQMSGIPVRSLHSILQKDHTPSLNRAATLCRTLGIEFYIGPRRDHLPLLEKVADALDLPPPTGIEEVIKKIDSLNRGDTAALERLLDDSEIALRKWRSETIDAVAEVMERMTAMRPTKDDDMVDSLLRELRLRLLPWRRQVRSATGGGAVVEDETAEAYLAFREEWLRKHGINPDRCSVIEVLGDSMEPTLKDGSAILVDRQRDELRHDAIFVVRTEDGLLVKRAVRAEEGNWQLASDNSDYPTLEWEQASTVIGRVVWAGTTLV